MEIENLTLEEQKMLLKYMETTKLVPEIDKAFRQIYANNVKQIVLATAIEGNSIWDKLQKLMPVIVIIATGLFIVFALYGFAPIIQAETTAASNIHLTCNVANAIINNSSGVSTSPPPI